MNRRTLLGLGGSTLSLAITGCLGEGTDPTGGTDDPDSVDDDGERRDPEADDENAGDEEEPAEGEDAEDGDGEELDGADDLTVVDIEFEAASGGGGSEGDGEARIERDGETVRVEGSIVGRNGCYTARLEEAVVEDGTLVVRVEAYEDAEEGEMCTQALVVIEYEVRIELAGEVTEVRVEHDGEAVASEG